MNLEEADSNQDDDPRAARDLHRPVGCQAQELGFLASQWILLAHWVGGRKLVEDAIRFALMECGNDTEFIGRQIETVQERAKPWLWREACLAAYKRRQNIPRPRVERFPGPTPVGAALATVVGNAPDPKIAQRFARISDRLRAGEEVRLWGLGRFNRYRVVKGEKTGKPEIIMSNGARRFLDADDLLYMTEE